MSAKMREIIDLIGASYTDDILGELIWIDDGSETNHRIWVNGVSDLSISLYMSISKELERALNKRFAMQDDESAWYEGLMTIHQDKDVELDIWLDSDFEEDDDKYLTIELTDDEKRVLRLMTDEWIIKLYGPHTIDEIFENEEKNIKSLFELEKKTIIRDIEAKVNR